MKTAFVVLGITALCATSAAQERSNPLFRGWLVENLSLEVPAAAAEYRRGTESDVAETTRALCLARLAEIDHDRGADAAASHRAAQLETVGIPGIEFDSSMPSTAPMRKALDDASEELDPDRRDEILDPARRQLLEAHRAVRRRARGLVEQVHEQVADRDVDFGPRRQRARVGSVGIRREWIEVIERHLAGRHESAERLAWFLLSFKPQTIEPDPETFARARFARVERLIESPRRTPKEKRVLEELRARTQRMFDARDFAAAATLLRRIPLPVQ